MKCLIFILMTFEQFGAIGDGIISDRIAVANALSYNNEITATPGAIYYIDGNIEIQDIDINIKGDTSNPAIFLFKNKSNIKLYGYPKSETTLKENTKIGDAYYIVNSTKDFNVGNLISVTTSESNSWGYDSTENDYRKGELHKIIAIENDCIYVENPIWHDWNIGKFIIKIKEYKPININISNVIFKYESPQDVSGIVNILYSNNGMLDNVRVFDSQNTGIMFDRCYNTIFKNGVVSGSNSKIAGYGVRFQSSSNSIVINNEFNRNFKSVESSSSPLQIHDYGLFPNRKIVVIDNYCLGDGLASDGIALYLKGNRFVNTHGTSQDVIVDNNIIEDCYHSVFTGGTDLQFINNNIRGNVYHSIVLVYGKNHIIKGNIINGIIGGSFVLLQDLNKDGGVDILDNEINTCKLYFVAVGGILDANNIKIINNKIKFADSLCYKYSDKSKLINVIEYANLFTGLNVLETKD